MFIAGEYKLLQYYDNKKGAVESPQHLIFYGKAYGSPNVGC